VVEAKVPDRNCRLTPYKAIATRAALGCSVRAPFIVLVLSRTCTIRQAWLLAQGALVSPLDQSLILQRVRE
jgi:hypothetical protein